MTLNVVLNKIQSDSGLTIRNLPNIIKRNTADARQLFSDFV